MEAVVALRDRYGQVHRNHCETHDRGECGPAPIPTPPPSDHNPRIRLPATPTPVMDTSEWESIGVSPAGKAATHSGHRPVQDGKEARLSMISDENAHI